MKKSDGCVWLVGAGPGDPGLITVAGMTALRAAEVVVYDALANPVLLNEAPAEADRIDVGKRAKFHRLKQEQINELLLAKAREGKRVVRLKGGDPYLFGRGGEEAVYLGERGVRCEVVPGITSGIAAPAAGGIPVTFRKVASTVTFVTGHEDPTKDESSVDYQGLARLIVAGGTVCFYMGVGRWPAIAGQLVRHAVNQDMPAAAVQWGTTWRQKVVRSTVSGLAKAMEEAGVGAPAIVVVGEVAGMEEGGLDYFASRPLLGKQVVVTRTRQQASTLRTELEAMGAGVIEAPTIAVEAVKDTAPVKQAMGQLVDGGYEWLILTSANGVAALAEWMKSMGVDGRALGGVKIAAVGAATTRTLWELLGLRADFEPGRATSEVLGRELVAKEGMDGRRVLLLRADIARPMLRELLESAGATVADVAVYQTRRAATLPEAVVATLRAGEVDWVTFTSASTAKNLVDLLGDERELLERCALASIGPVTSDAMREAGLTVTTQAKHADIQGLVEAIVRATQKAGRGAEE